MTDITMTVMAGTIEVITITIKVIIIITEMAIIGARTVTEAITMADTEMGIEIEMDNMTATKISGGHKRYI